MWRKSVNLAPSRNSAGLALSSLLIALTMDTEMMPLHLLGGHVIHAAFCRLRLTKGL